jgi:hypothetical protein
MPTNPPVDFEEKIRGATGTTNKDYPYAIKATDLMQDFVFATLDIADGIFEETTGLNGYIQRRLKIPAINNDGNRVLASTSGVLSWKEDIPTPPATGTYVLGAITGVIQWISTEECE